MARQGRTTADLSRSWLIRLLLVPLAQSVAVMATLPMVSYRAIEIGATPGQVGLVGGSFALLSTLVAVPSGRWVDRWGAPRFVVLGTVSIGVADVWLAFAGNVPALAAGVMVLGLGFVFCVVGVQTVLASHGHPSDRERRFGYYTVVCAVGWICGPLLVGLLVGRLGYEAEVLFGAVAALMVAACGIAVSLWLEDSRTERVAPHPRQAPGSRPGGSESLLRALVRLLRLPTVWHAMVASLIVGVTADVIVIYLPVFGEAHDISVGTVALLLAVMSLASIVARLMMMPLLRALGRRRLLVWSMITSAVAVTCFPLLPVVPVLFVLISIVGIGLGLGPPLTMAWVAGAVPRSDMGMAFGVRQTANRAGNLVVPAVAGAIAGATGLGAVFLVLTALLAGGAWLVVRTPANDHV